MILQNIWFSSFEIVNILRQYTHATRAKFIIYVIFAIQKTKLSTVFIIQQNDSVKYLVLRFLNVLPDVLFDMANTGKFMSGSSLSSKNTISKSLRQAEYWFCKIIKFSIFEMERLFLILIKIHNYSSIPVDSFSDFIACERVVLPELQNGRAETCSYCWSNVSMDCNFADSEASFTSSIFFSKIK